MSKNLFTISLAIASFSIYYLIINPLYTGEGSLWKPQNGLKNLMQLDKDYTDTLSQAKALYERARGIGSDFDSVSPESKDKMLLMLPDSIDPVRLLNEVDYIANKAGLPLDDLSYSEKNSNSSNGMKTATAQTVSVAAPIIMPGANSEGKGNTSSTQPSTQTAQMPGVQNQAGGQTASKSAKSSLGVYEVNFKVKTTYKKFKDLMANYENSLRLFSVKEVKFSKPDKKTGMIDFDVKLETYFIK